MQEVYYIDGYNLLFRLCQKEEDLAARRQFIIQDLYPKIASLNIVATLVFDSHHYPEPASRTLIGPLEIIFTAEGQTADEWILENLKRIAKPRHCVIVTSDKKLAWHARRSLAKTETVEEFITWLNRRFEKSKRNQKKPAVQHAIKPQAEKPPAKKRIPSSKVSVEECRDYYLEVFESRLEHTPPIKVSKSPPHGKSPKKERPARKISEFERWLNAFEKRLTDQ